MQNTLDHLVGNGVAPMIVAFVERPARTRRSEFDGDRMGDHTRMLVEELLPALEHPGVFGKVGLYSLYMPEPQATALLEKLEGVKPTEVGEFTLLWNRYELNRQDWSLDLKQHSDRMIEALKRRGIGVSAEEMPNGYGWGAWRQQAGGVLGAFFAM